MKIKVTSDDPRYASMAKQMDDVFSEMDKVFKRMDTVMEEVMEQASTEYKAPWKPWFAWRPVTVKGKRIWMKQVYRRRTNTYVNHDDWAQYEYGDLFDVLQET